MSIGELLFRKVVLDEFNLTDHVKYGRSKRIERIEKNGGFGFITSVKPADRGLIKCITSTKVMMIIDPKDNTLITTYPMTQAKYLHQVRA